MTINIKFSIKEYKEAGLDDLCKNCRKVHCDGWKRVMLDVDGHQTPAWQCEVYTIL